MPGRSSVSQLRSFGSETGKENDSELSCFGHNGCKLRRDMHLALCPLDASGFGRTIEVSLMILAFVELWSVGGTVVRRVGLLLALNWSG